MVNDVFRNFLSVINLGNIASIVRSLIIIGVVSIANNQML